MDREPTETALLVARVRATILSSPGARIVIEGRVRDVMFLVDALCPEVVEIATPDFQADLQLALDAGLEVFDAHRPETTPNDPRPVIIVTSGGEISCVSGRNKT